MLRQLLVISSLAAVMACGSVQAGEAGKVVFVSGQAQLAQHAALLDASVQEGDELKTGADGYIYVKTIDSGFLILRPNSRARISAYHIDQSNPANTRVKLELLGGVARSISGQAVKQARQNFRFNTPVAAIGVRGTDFTVYTDEQTSRVTVGSGGIVVSAFSNACGPEGGGPCEGSSSRELFAGQAGTLLQVQRGQLVPQLLHSPVLAPDMSAPPRGNEPIGKVGKSAQPGIDVSLDAQKGGDLLGGDQPVLVPVVPPELVVIPKSPPEVLWGRWQAVAGVAENSDVMARLADGTFAPAAFVGSYAIARLKESTLIMPREGQASFSLAASDVVIQEKGGAGVAASVENAFLDINFNNRTFATGMTVVGQDMRVPVNGKGDVTLKGELVSDRLSETLVRGFLGGARAEEAGDIFQNSAPNVTVMGATTWSR